MRLGIWGPADDPLTTQLHRRALERGATTSGSPIRPERDEAAAAAGLDAAVVTLVGHNDARRALLASLDAALRPSLPILACCHDAAATALAAGLGHAERLVGFGLVPPIDTRARVECARGLATNDAAAARAEGVWRHLGLEPAWVGDGAGLVTARVVACLANEAAFALMDGTASATDIDRAMTLGTRYPRGPLAWASEVGIDHILAVLDALAAEHGDDRYRAAPLLRHLAAAGRTRGWVWPSG